MKTSIYTGIVSGSSISTSDDQQSTSIQTVNNTFDNLINLITTQTTLENVALKLFAMDMIYGNKKADNQYITAKHFQKLNETVPPEVRRMIDYSSIDKTAINLKRLERNSSSNYIYKLLNDGHPNYSYNALSKVQVKRIQNSDMVEISFTGDDPGITTCTVKLFNEELVKSYDDLRYKSTNDVIKYFEAQVNKYKGILNQQENVLTDYNVKNGVINYTDQTKELAISYNDYLNRCEEAQRRVEGSKRLLDEMSKQMDTRTKLFYTNKDFIKTLNDITTLNTRITDSEMFSSEEAQNRDENLKKYRQQLRDKESDISRLSKNMDMYKYTKEGLAIQQLADNWIAALVENAKAEAELRVLNQRKPYFETEYRKFSPVGTEIKRRERDISVTENSYLEMIHALNLAYLRKKNIQLTTSGLNTVSEALFPLEPNKSKRWVFILAAFFGSMVFIILYKLIIEMLDRTLRDGDRAKRLTGVKPIGAMVGKGELRYRGYSKTWNRIAIANIGSKLNGYLHPDVPNYVNVLSFEPGEGKSYFAKFLGEECDRIGLQTLNIDVDEDMTETSGYALAKDYSSLISNLEASNYNVIILEYPALALSSVPKALLRSAAVNLVIVNAKRVWRKSDAEILEHLQELVGDTPCEMILNNADRYDVEDYTGDLPPARIHKYMSMRFMHMGLTSKKTAVE
ncbi:MAG: hypothetical protein LKF31_02330 [Muribaculaceae bacterium]|nr:hypothetical protein [Muribaculaceae bacterium]